MAGALCGCSRQLMRPWEGSLRWIGVSLMAMDAAAGSGVSAPAVNAGTAVETGGAHWRQWSDGIELNAVEPRIVDLEDLLGRAAPAVPGTWCVATL